MEINIIYHVISHIQKHFRIKVPSHKNLCLLLDGHSSRNGIKWLKAAKSANIVVVQAPNNTSHFLQPNKDAVNWNFKRAIKATHKFLLSKQLLSCSSVGMKLWLGVAGYRSITQDIAQRAWFNTGLWPMDFRFVKIAIENCKGEVRNKRDRGAPRGERPQTALKRFENILHSRKRTEQPKETFEKLSQIIQIQTPKKVLGAFINQGIARTSSPTSIQDKKRTVYRHGGPALYLTHGEFIERRENILKRKMEDKKQKEALKEERALK